MTAAQQENIHRLFAAHERMILQLHARQFAIVQILQRLAEHLPSEAGDIIAEFEVLSQDELEKLILRLGDTHPEWAAEVSKAGDPQGVRWKF